MEESTATVQPKSYVFYEGDPAISCIARFIDIVR